MATNLVRTALAKGVNLSVLHDPKFKHNRLTVNMIVPLSEKTVSGYAVLPFIMRKGSKSCRDFTELNRRLDSLYGAALACDVNKAGSNQIITLAVKVLDDSFTLNGEKLLEEAASLLRELIFEPLITDGAFDEQSFALEKQFLIDTIEAQINDKRSFAVSQCRRLMGRNDAAAIQKYGTVEGARSLTARSAAESCGELLKNASVEIMFIGPGDPSAASQVMKKAFAGTEREAQPFADAMVCPAGERVLEQTEYFDVTQSKMVLGFRTGARGSLEEQAAMRLMAALYGGTPSSKLFLNVREKLSLCYYCAARYDRTGAVMMVDCGVEKENIESARREILSQLDAIKNGDFDDATLENTRLQLKNGLRSISDSPSSLEDWYIAQIISGDMVSPDEHLAMIESVTREQVIAAARAMTLDAVYILTSKEDKADAN